MTAYPEINRYGLTEYHKQRLCYPWTPAPAFTFWEPPSGAPNDGLCPIRTWQDGRCGLCGFRGNLVEDHCHTSGLVRGMLCRSCNVREGVSSLNLEEWRGGVTVASLLGVLRLYVNPFG